MTIQANYYFLSSLKIVYCFKIELSKFLTKVPNWVTDARQTEDAEEDRKILRERGKEICITKSPESSNYNQRKDNHQEHYNTTQKEIVHQNNVRKQHEKIKNGMKKTLESPTKPRKVEVNVMENHEIHQVSYSTEELEVKNNKDNNTRKLQETAPRNFYQNNNNNNNNTNGTHDHMFTHKSNLYNITESRGNKKNNPKISFLNI